MAIDYINALGAGASFDTKKIVEALVEAERAPAKADSGQPALGDVDFEAFFIITLKVCIGFDDNRTKTKPVNLEGIIFNISSIFAEA